MTDYADVREHFKYLPSWLADLRWFCTKFEVITILLWNDQWGWQSSSSKFRYIASANKISVPSGRNWYYSHPHTPHSYENTTPRVFRKAVYTHIHLIWGVRVLDYPIIIVVGRWGCSAHLTIAHFLAGLDELVRRYAFIGMVGFSPALHRSSDISPHLLSPSCREPRTKSLPLEGEELGSMGMCWRGSFCVDTCN